MNLSHSTAVVLARIYADLKSEKGERHGKSVPLAKTALSPARLGEFEGMIGHWGEFLTDLGLTQAGNPEQLVSSFRQIFARTDLTPREVRALRGFLSKAPVKLGVRSNSRQTNALRARK